MMIMWKPKYFQEMITNSVYMHDGRVGQPQLDQDAQTHRLHRLVHEAVRREHQLEDEPRDDLGDDVRREEQQPEHRATAEVAVERQRQRTARTGSGRTATG